MSAGHGGGVSSRASDRRGSNPGLHRRLACLGDSSADPHPAHPRPRLASLALGKG